MALSKEKRLKLAGDFRSVFRGQLSSKQGRVLLKARSSQKPCSRFGVVISKAVSKKAVERNRMRRLLTEALAEKQDSLQTPHDIILVVLPGFSLKGLEEAKELVQKVFKKAGLARATLDNKHDFQFPSSQFPNKSQFPNRTNFQTKTKQNRLELGN